MKKSIKEIIVVEGKDDVSAVRRAVDATILITNGMGLEEARLKEIAAMAKKQGVIVLTDPDVPGTLIRNRITELVPDAPWRGICFAGSNFERIREGLCHHRC